MEVEKKRLWLKVSLCVLSMLLLLAASYIALRPGNILPAGFRYGIYSAGDGADSIEKGCAVVTDRRLRAGESSVVTYIQDGERFFAEGDVQGGAEVVVYKVSALGGIIDFLAQYRIWVWCATGVAAAAWLIFFLTAKRRRMKRRREQLLQAFEFYGQKYDLEDATIDY